jgi:putative nucleotidyltransferase with HDIG domain
MSQPLEKVLREIGELPAMPVVAQRVIELSNNERSSAEQMARVISSDQGLSTRLLKMANSALYGSPQTVDSVNQAIVRLGFDTTERIVVQAAVREMFRPVDELDERLWDHAVRSAIAACIVARTSRAALADEALTAGLLHDVGKTIMKLHDPKRYATVVGEARNTGRWSQPEWDAFGFEHTEAGALVLAHWGLSLRLALVAHHHHATELFDSSDVGRARRHVAGLDPGAARLVATVSLADEITHRLDGAPWLEATPLPLHQLRSARFLGIGAEQVDPLVEEIRRAREAEAGNFA